MRRDSKAFRERFQRWKAGEAVYDAGKPIEHCADGREGIYDSRYDAYEGGTLPGITVTGNAPKKGLYPVKYRFDPHKWTTARTKQADFGDIANMANVVGLGLLPGASDVEDIANVADDVQNKNYMSAGIGLGLLALPNVLEKPIKTISKFIKAPGTKRVVNDIISNPKRVIKDYLDEDYPITIQQRRKFIEKRNKYYNELADRADDLERQQRIKRVDRSKNKVVLFAGPSYPMYFSPRTARAQGEIVSGAYNPGRQTLISPNRTNPNSNFNNYKSLEANETFFHEYTHHQQNDKWFAPHLKLSKYSKDAGYYIPDFTDLHFRSGEFNPFLPIQDASFVAQRARRDNSHSKLFQWESSPDEAVAELRSFILARPDMSPEKVLNSKRVQDYMKRQFGLESEDIRMMFDIGY